MYFRSALRINICQLSHLQLGNRIITTFCWKCCPNKPILKNVIKEFWKSWAFVVKRLYALPTKRSIRYSLHWIFEGNCGQVFSIILSCFHLQYLFIRCFGPSTSVMIVKLLYLPTVITWKISKKSVPDPIKEIYCSKLLYLGTFSLVKSANYIHCKVCVCIYSVNGRFIVI